jgi:hypothetical protein
VCRSPCENSDLPQGHACRVGLCEQRFGMDYTDRHSDRSEALAAAVNSAHALTPLGQSWPTQSRGSYMHAIDHLREASQRLRLLEEHADDLDRRLRSTEEKAAEDRIAAERKVSLAETRAIEAERRAEAAEAHAAQATGKAELLLGVITEELGGTIPIPFHRSEGRPNSELTRS